MLKIYLETTIFNFPFADDAPQYRDATLKMFKKIENGLFAPYTSDYVIDELKDDKSAKRTDMLSLIDKYCIKVFTHKPLSVTLATEYVKQGMIPKKYETDALHIATCSTEEIPIIVSLNFKHIVKIKTKVMCSTINTLYGLKCPIICTPEEVINYDKDL